jgi:hypothetical protein
VQLTNGSQLTLGGDLDTTGDNSVLIAGNSTLDAGGHDIATFDLQITAGSQLLNRGTIDVARNLIVTQGAGQAFDLNAGDETAGFFLVGGSTTFDVDASARSINLNNATATTASTGNLSGTISLNNGSVLNLGADLSLATGSAFTISTDSLLNAAGHDVTASGLTFQSGGQYFDDGALTVNGLLTVASDITLHGGDDLVNALTISDGGLLSIQQSGGGLAGLTLLGNLNIGATGTLSLQFDSSVVPGSLDWALRWRGDRVGALNGLIDAGRITIDSPFAASVFTRDDGFTYVGYTSFAPVVPEPSSIALTLLGGFGLAASARRLARRGSLA